MTLTYGKEFRHVDEI